MKPFPLETLLRTREHRERRAMQAVVEQRAALAVCVREMEAIRARLVVITSEEARLADGLAAGPRHGEYDITRLTSIDDRRALLREQSAAVQAELRAASDKVDEERRKLADCLYGYRRARAKKDSASVQRDRWQTRQKSLDDRRDEHAAEEYTSSRYVLTERFL